MSYFISGIVFAAVVYFIYSKAQESSAKRSGSGGAPKDSDLK